MNNVEWTAWFDAPEYEFARQVLQRGIATIFLVAFLSCLNQFPALLGERGLLPVPDYVDSFRRRKRPSLFLWRYSDRLLRSVCWSGMAIAGTIVAGLPQLGPPWLPMIAFLSLWLLYMSIVNVGQTFYGFGWEMLLLEAGFIVAFLGSDQTPPPRTILILLAWLLFRLEFGAGMIKIRGGSEWRDLTALFYHHETQPMPGPLSRQAHLLPKPLHRMEVLGNHFAQLVVPFFLFAPAAAGQRRRGHRHLHPAVARGERELRLAQLDGHPAGLRGGQRSGGPRRAARPSRWTGTGPVLRTAQARRPRCGGSPSYSP